MNCNSDLLEKQITTITDILSTTKGVDVTYSCARKRWSVCYDCANQKDRHDLSYTDALALLQDHSPQDTDPENTMDQKEIDRLTGVYEQFRKNTESATNGIWMITDRHSTYRLPSVWDNNFSLIDCVKYLTLVKLETAWSIFVDPKATTHFHHDYTREWSTTEEQLKVFVETVKKMKPQNSYNTTTTLTNPLQMYKTQIHG